MKQVSSGLEVIWSFKTIEKAKSANWAESQCTRSGFSPLAAYAFYQIEMF